MDSSILPKEAVATQSINNKIVENKIVQNQIDCKKIVGGQEFEESQESVLKIYTTVTFKQDSKFKSENLKDDKDSYGKMIKNRCTSEFDIDGNQYGIDIKLYSDDELNIQLEEVATQLKYEAKLSPKKIMLMTQEAQFILTSKQFYDILVSALAISLNTTLAICLNSMDLRVIWTHTVMDSKIFKTFDIALKAVEMKEMDRFDNLMRSLSKKTGEVHTLEDKVSKLLEKVASLENSFKVPGAAIKSGIQSNVINVTVCNDYTRRTFAYETFLFKFFVNKKLPDTILLIHGAFCVAGGNASNCPIICTYGRSTAIGQADNGSSAARSFNFMIIIDSNRETGSREMCIRFDGLPFTVFNPNKNDHYNDFQTSSVVKVEEIQQ